MRGAYAAGALLGIYSTQPAFDAVYASSSGACSAAYMVAEQPTSVSIWRDHLHGQRLLRVRNVARGRPYLDLDYLIDEVFGRRIPLDLAKLRAAPTPLWVTLTRASDGGVEYRDLRHERDPLQVLRATAALPIAYPKPVLVDGRPYVDGGMGDPIPVVRALDDGADDITVVLTKPLGYRRAPAKRALTWFASRPYPGAARSFATLHERYNAALALIQDPPAGVTMRVVAPSADLHLTRLMTAGRHLRRAVARGLTDGSSPQVAQGHRSAPA